MGNQPSTPVDASEAEKRNERRAKIAREIFETEASYVASLMIVAELYIMPLMNSLKQPKPILSEAEIKSIFSYWNNILEFHTKVLKPQIHARIEKWSPTQNIGDVFVENSDMLKIYTLYVNNYDSVHDKIAAFSKRKEFKAFLLEAKSSPRHSQIDIFAYLIMPIQRIPRYVMLLSDLLKHTEPNHLDYKNISTGLNKVQGVATYINENKREDENAKKMLAVSKSIEGRFEEPLLQPHRRLVREGEIELIQALAKIPQSPIEKKTDSPKRFTLFSFGRDKKAKKSGFLLQEGGDKSVWGFVSTFGGIIGSFHKIWAVLDGITLNIYPEEFGNKGKDKDKDKESETKPTEVVDLSNAQILNEEQKKKVGKPVECIVIELAKDKYLILKEDDKSEKPEKEFAEWKKLFEEVCKKKDDDSSRSSLVESESTEEFKDLGISSGKYYIFLFNDLVVLCEKSGKMYKLKVSNQIQYYHKITRMAENFFIYEMDNIQFQFKDTPANVEKWVTDMQQIINDMEQERKNRALADEKPSSVWQSFSNFFH